MDNQNIVREHINRKRDMQSDRILAFVRVSRPAYNQDIYESGKIYFNPQSRFVDSEGLTEGQGDNKEGLVYASNDSEPMVLKPRGASGLEGIEFRVSNIRVNPNAYIFCTYAVRISDLEYDKSNGVYLHTIPWDYIQKFTSDTEKNEILIIGTPERFNNALNLAAKKRNFSYISDSVIYDLEDRLNDPRHFREVMQDSSKAIFHKSKKHESEKEFRFALIDNEKRDHNELFIEDLNNISMYILPVENNASLQLAFYNIREEEGRILYDNRIGCRLI